MTVNVKFARVREDAIIPTKRDEDAGWDKIGRAHV